MELYFIFSFFIGTHKLTSFVLSDLNRGIITFILHKFNVYDKKDIRNKGDSVVVGIVGMCITGCLMELWVTLFAGRGKAALSLFHVL